MTEQQHRQLLEALNQLLADTAVFRHKAQAYHWSVRGVLFGQFHGQFGEIYDDMLLEDYDKTAEQIRVLGSVPLVGLSNYADESSLEPPNDEFLNETLDENKSAILMAQELYKDNERLIQTIEMAEDAAEEAEASGVLGFLNGRHDTHNEIRYKLGSYLGGPTSPISGGNDE